MILERIALPATLFPGLSLPIGEELAEEFYVIYQQRFGVTIVRAAEQLRAVGAGAEEGRHLGVPRGAPLLEIDRLALTLDGAPAEWRLSRCSTAHHRYAVEID